VNREYDREGGMHEITGFDLYKQGDGEEKGGSQEEEGLPKIESRLDKL
jgi:hypothetical protein